MNDDMKMVPDEKSALVERIKELDCLYHISRLFSQHSLRLEDLLKEIVKIIPGAWQFPERTCVRISYDGWEYRSKNYSLGSTSQKETIESKKRKCGFVEVAYLDEGSRISRKVFLEDEKKLLKAITGLLGSIIEKKEAEMSLKQTTDELHKQTLELENKNIALREIVSQIGLEKKALQDQMRLNIALTVLPLLNKMQNPNVPPESWKSYLRVAQQNLEDITSSLARKVIEDRVRLSPRELEICNLIKNGLSNKEITALLHISLLTVERHRHNVRKKLRIDNKKVNLATFLRDL
jgi:ATP/maltotriose-dependent transcriptional regulator MalT